MSERRKRRRIDKVASEKIVGVGAARFELTTSWTQTRRACRAAPRPDGNSLFSGRSAAGKGPGWLRWRGEMQNNGGHALLLRLFNAVVLIEVADKGVFVQGGFFGDFACVQQFGAKMHRADSGDAIAGGLR